MGASRRCMASKPPSHSPEGPSCLWPQAFPMTKGGCVGCRQQGKNESDPPVSRTRAPNGCGPARRGPEPPAASKERLKTGNFFGCPVSPAPALRQVTCLPPCVGRRGLRLKPKRSSVRPLGPLPADWRGGIFEQQRGRYTTVPPGGLAWFGDDNTPCKQSSSH